jgi:hypothetical protein
LSLLGLLVTSPIMWRGAGRLFSHNGRFSSGRSARPSAQGVRDYQIPHHVPERVRRGGQSASENDERIPEWGAARKYRIDELPSFLTF